MRLILNYFSHFFFIFGIVYILMYTFLPGIIPSWFSLSPTASLTVLLMWAIHLPYYLIQLTKK